MLLDKKILARLLATRRVSARLMSVHRLYQITVNNVFPWAPNASRTMAKLRPVPIWATKRANVLLQLFAVKSYQPLVNSVLALAMSVSVLLGKKRLVRLSATKRANVLVLPMFAHRLSQPTVKAALISVINVSRIMA